MENNFKQVLKNSIETLNKHRELMNQKTFVFCIEEHLTKTVKITARTAEEAETILKQLYKDETIVLSADDYASTQFAIIEPESEVTEWKEM